MSTILIPDYLVTKYSLPSSYQCDQITVHKSFLDLSLKYPDFKSFLFDSSGNVRKFINVFVDGEDVRLLSGMQTSVTSSSEITLVIAVAGG